MKKIRKKKQYKETLWLSSYFFLLFVFFISHCLLFSIPICFCVSVFFPLTSPNFKLIIFNFSCTYVLIFSFLNRQVFYEFFHYFFIFLWPLFTYLQVASGMEIEDYRAANPKIHEVPFNSSNKWQMSIHSMQYMGGKQLLLLKVLFISF